MGTGDINGSIRLPWQSSQNGLDTYSAKIRCNCIGVVNAVVCMMEVIVQLTRASLPAKFAVIDLIAEEA
jgi:hypothetical protein